MTTGMKTSEFWTIIATMVCVVVLVVTDHEAAIPYIVGLAGLHTVKRTVEKTVNGK